MKKTETTEEQPKVLSIIELQSLAYEHAQEIDRLTSIFRQIQATITQRKAAEQTTTE